MEIWPVRLGLSKNAAFMRKVIISGNVACAIIDDAETKEMLEIHTFHRASNTTAFDNARRSVNKNGWKLISPELPGK